MLLTLALGAALAALVAMAGTAERADAAAAYKIVFTSNRTAGTGVNNPTGDYELFSMNADGTGVRQLNSNKVDDYEPTLSPDGTKVTYTNRSASPSNPEGDKEVYVMNALDGSGKKNLSNNDVGVYDHRPQFSPGGKNNLTNNKDAYDGNYLPGQSFASTQHFSNGSSDMLKCCVLMARCAKIQSFCTPL